MGLCLRLWVLPEAAWEPWEGSPLVLFLPNNGNEEWEHPCAYLSTRTLDSLNRLRVKDPPVSVPFQRLQSLGSDSSECGLRLLMNFDFDQWPFGRTMNRTQSRMEHSMERFPFASAHWSYWRWLIRTSSRGRRARFARGWQRTTGSTHIIERFSSKDTGIRV